MDVVCYHCSLPSSVGAATAVLSNVYFYTEYKDFLQIQTEVILNMVNNIYHVLKCFMFFLSDFAKDIHLYERLFVL